METIIHTYLSSEWMPIVAAVVTLANAITMFVDSKSTNPIWGVFNDALNFISGNVLANKNADSE